MRVPVKLLGFGIWLLSLHCAQCEECLLESNTYEDTEPLEKASYTDGETVKVNCMTGYIGLYKLKCEKGKWKNLIVRPCAKKKCSHPGDIPNGDFKLSEGTEFVFGVTVVYTCRTGYEMVSRINQRTCRGQGWDNTVPLCEVVKCPAVRTDGDVTASGNTEEGSYGEVIHFECVSSDKMIDGSSDIYCTETGKWSDSVPTCIDIKCTAPDIPNGQVEEKMSEYRKGAVLQYKCNSGFKKREGIPKCAKFGWTIKPECDEVTCTLESTTFGIRKIIPEGKTIFRARESVEIVCAEKFFLIFTKHKSKTCTCQENGKWDHQPACQEIRCEVPRGQHVYDPEYYFRGDKKLGKKQHYYCESGYEKMAAEATCTEDGWTPNPLCEKMCAAPNIPRNTEIVGGKSVTSKYKILSTITYKCLPGFEPEEPIQITCNSWAEWTGIQHCTEKMCAAPSIPNAEIVGGLKSKYQINLRIQYKCLLGFEPVEPVQITCDSQGQWTGIQQCTELCSEPSVENGFVINQPSNKEKIFYSCNTGYKPFTGKGWDLVTCSKGSWSDEPRCIREEECGALPSVHHGKLNQAKRTFRDGETTEFECDPGFISTPRFIECINGTWKKPVCKEGAQCGIPPRVENAAITSKPQDFYVNGSSVTYICRKSFLIRGKSVVFCHNRTWKKTPTCEEEVHCDRPPDVKNAVTTLKSEEFYLDGSNVTYKCIQSSFSMSGKSTVFCRNGTWEKTPTCEAKCHKPRANFMKLVNEKDVYDNEEILNFKCIEPYNETPEGQWICENGKWNRTVICTNEICPPPPYVENGDYDIKRRDGQVITEVQYRCQTYYVLNDRKIYRCENGKWKTPPKCLKPCEITDDIFEAHNIDPSSKKGYLEHGKSQEFYCKYSTSNGWTKKSLKCSDGKLNVAPCRQYK